MTNMNDGNKYLSLTEVIFISHQPFKDNGAIKTGWLHWLTQMLGGVQAGTQPLDKGNQTECWREISQFDRNNVYISYN